MLKFPRFTFNGVPGEVSNESKIAMKKVNLYDGLFPPFAYWRARQQNCKYSWITHKSEQLDQGKSETAI